LLDICSVKKNLRKKGGAASHRFLGFRFGYLSPTRYDGGSTDGTWEIVKKLTHSSIVDEFYVGDPKAFFSRVPRGQDLVWGIMAEYVLTETDVGGIDFSLPFEKVMPLLRHYYVAWSEPRAFRYRDGLIWSDDWAWPRHAGIVAKERIIYKHYPCRSPKQLQARWKTRRENRERGFKGWKEDVEGWRQAIKNSKEFAFDDGISPLKIDESALPQHLEVPYVRFAKQILYRCGIWP
jgi:hypothetical protein